MKVIIAGSRTITDYETVKRAIESSPFTITEVVSGHCPDGVDALGEQWAAEKGLLVKRFEADWERFGRSAGPRRNGEMAAYADALVCVWNGRSRGSKDMIEKALRARLEVDVTYVRRRKKPLPALTTGEEE